MRLSLSSSSAAVDSATIAHAFTITAAGASSATPYVQAAALDGKPFERTYLATCELRRRGRLAFRLGATPNTAWASAPAAAPPSLSDERPAPTCG